MGNEKGFYTKGFYTDGNYWGFIGGGVYMKFPTPDEYAEYVREAASERSDENAV